MLTLASGTGAQDCEVGETAFPEERWRVFRSAACRLLRARGQEEAAQLLEEFPFELREGQNFFGDEFVVLMAELDMERYTACVEAYTAREQHAPFRQIKRALNEICPAYVRFVAVAARLDATSESVPEPDLRLTSRAVTEALNDARFLIRGRGSTSGIDRAHTAFHGYLRVLCEEAGIGTSDDADVTTLFRALRQQHPNLVADGARGHDITRVLRALATIVDTLNPVRNRASLAHANEELLEEPEADLMINAMRSVLRYLDKKLS